MLKRNYLENAFKAFLALTVAVMLGCGKKSDTGDNSEKQNDTDTAEVEQTIENEEENASTGGLEVIDSVIIDENGNVTEVSGSDSTGESSSSGNISSGGSSSESGSDQGNTGGNSGSSGSSESGSSGNTGDQSSESGDSSESGETGEQGDSDYDEGAEGTGGF